MQRPFENDTPTDSIEPIDQTPADTDIPTPIADPAADDLTDAAPAGPPMTDEPVAPSATPPVTLDAGAAQRRITMQLYSRMVTDLKVLTGDKRVPTDAEIDEALNRAVRALGVWQPARQDAVWRGPADGVLPAPRFASFDPADPARRLPILSNAYGKENPSVASSGSPFRNLAGIYDDEQAQTPATGLAPVTAAPPLSPADAKRQAKAAKAAKRAGEKAARDDAKTKKKAADLAKKTGPVSMAIDMLPGDFRQSLATLWGNLAGHVPSQAEKDAEKNRKRQNDEREKHGLPALSPPPKNTFEERDLDAAVAEQLKKPGSVTYDQPNPTIAGFVLDIAKATAAAKIKGAQEFEKMMIISPDAAKPGDFRVRWIGLTGANGGRPPAMAPGDVIVHVHYTGLNQPPHKADFSSALSGRVGYVISGDGSKVWEVRRNGKSVAIDPSNLAGRLQGVEVGRLLPNGKTRYEPFQIKPERYSPGNQ